MYSAIRTGVLFFLAILAFSDSQFVLGQGGTDTSGTGGRNSIKGRIYLPNGRALETPITVELQSTAHPPRTTFTDRDGHFLFASLSAGSYTVVVDAGEDFEVERESFMIDRESQGRVRLSPMPRALNFPVYLRPKRRASMGRAEIISAKLSSVPKPAADLYEKAQLSIGKNDMPQAMVELRQAINIYRAFSLAWNDLGVLLERAGDAKQAVDAFRMAVRSDPDSFAALLNLGSALVEINQFDEAEKYLAIALTKNAASFRGHFYMGITQTKLGRLDIAEQAFLQAIKIGGDQTSRAHYLLAGVYWATKNYKRAADELEKYLTLEPKAKDAVKTRESIAELRRKAE